MGVASTLQNRGTATSAPCDGEPLPRWWTRGRAGVIVLYQDGGGRFPACASPNPLQDVRAEAAAASV